MAKKTTRIRQDSEDVMVRTSACAPGTKTKESCTSKNTLNFLAVYILWRLASYTQKHHYFYIVRFLSPAASKAKVSETKPLTSVPRRPPLALHVLVLPLLKKRKNSHDALSTYTHYKIQSFNSVFFFYFCSVFYLFIFFLTDKFEFYI